MMNTVSKRRGAVAAIAAAVVILLAVGGIFASRMLTAATEPEDSVAQSSAMSTDPETPSPLPPIANLPVPASFPDDMVKAIEASGGYRVVGSPVSDALLVAEEGAVSIPWRERSWGEWVEEVGGTFRSEGQTPEFVELSADIMELVSAHPDNLGEAAFSSYDTFLEVFARDTEGAGIANIAQLLEERGLAGKVVIVQVPYSRSDMDAAQEAIMEAWEEDMGSGTADFILSKILFSVGAPEAEATFQERSKNEELTVADIIAASPNPAAADSLDSRLAGIPVLIELYAEISSGLLEIESFDEPS